MALVELVLPARLGWIKGQKSNEFARLLSHIIQHELVRHPDAGELGLAAKDNGLATPAGGGVILLPADSQVHLCIARPPRLLAKILGKMIGIFEGVTVNVNQHGPLYTMRGRISICSHPGCPLRRADSRGSADSLVRAAIGSN